MDGGTGITGSDGGLGLYGMDWAWTEGWMGGHGISAWSFDVGNNYRTLGRQSNIVCAVIL